MKRYRQTAPCGCSVWFRVDVDEGTIHVEPCSPAHAPSMQKAAREAADTLGYTIVEDN
jgi:hypothetical protein